MKIIYLTAVGCYLLGVIIAFLLLIKDVGNAWHYKNRYETIKSTFRNTWKFYLRSWEAVFWILMKRKL